MNFAMVRAGRDAESISDLAQLCRIIHGEAKAPDISYWAESDYEPYFILVNGESIGIAVVKRNADAAATYNQESPRAEGSLYLCFIGIVPIRRRYGFGRLVMLWLRTLARIGRYTRIVSNVRLSNMASQNLHVSCGFGTLGTQKDYYPDGEASLIMEYRL